MTRCFSQAPATPIIIKAAKLAGNFLTMGVAAVSSGETIAISGWNPVDLRNKVERQTSLLKQRRNPKHVTEFVTDTCGLFSAGSKYLFVRGVGWEIQSSGWREGGKKTRAALSLSTLLPLFIQFLLCFTCERNSSFLCPIWTKTLVNCDVNQHCTTHRPGKTFFEALISVDNTLVWTTSKHKKLPFCLGSAKLRIKGIFRGLGPKNICTYTHDCISVPWRFHRKVHDWELVYLYQYNTLIPASRWCMLVLERDTEWDKVQQYFLTFYRLFFNLAQVTTDQCNVLEEPEYIL